MYSTSKRKIGDSCRGGFSIMEVIIATGIVSTSFVVLMSLFSYNLHVEMLNRNKIIAAYLAQEAIEIVKQARDTNWFSGATWDSGIYNPAYTTDLILKSNNTNNPTLGWTIQHVASAAYKKIYLSNGSFVQSDGVIAGGQDTGFERYLSIDESGDYITITVDVSYNKNINHVRVTSYLYNNWNS